MAVKDSDADGVRVAPAPSVTKMALASGAAAFVAVLAAQMAAPLLPGFSSARPAATAGATEDGAAVDPRTLGPAIYLPLDPPLVVSFTDGAGRTRFMQLTLQAMSRNQKSLDNVRQHSPALRNAFLFLISKRSIDELSGVDGKEQLRADMLQEARSIMRSNTGDDSIEELYFTSLVIQ